jgi:hypothetical protein
MRPVASQPASSRRGGSTDRERDDHDAGLADAFVLMAGEGGARRVPRKMHILAVAAHDVLGSVYCRQSSAVRSQAAAPSRCDDFSVTSCHRGYTSRSDSGSSPVNGSTSASCHEGLREPRWLAERDFRLVFSSSDLSRPTATTNVRCRGYRGLIEARERFELAVARLFQTKWVRAGTWSTSASCSTSPRLMVFRNVWPSGSSINS